ncbi:MAG: hypothetical protein H0T97_03470 [Actinobacteria bacterium]|nr:hypothetical protein [Actinomycetota bacterium]
MVACSASGCRNTSLTAVLFACLAGVFFAGLNITMRRGLARVADVDVGSAAIATFGSQPENFRHERFAAGL